MEKKRPLRFPYTLRYGIAAAIVIVITISLFYPGDSNVVTLGYGPFKQLVRAPGAQFQNLRVGRTIIRGEVTFPDRVTSGDDKNKTDKPIPFRVSRQGVDPDPALFALLDAHAPGYEAEGDKSGLAIVMEILTYLILILLLVVVGVYVARRWFGIGGFGRGRHRLYAGHDKRLTFADVAGIEEAKAELKEVVDFLQ